jgi:hypothetical protein
VIHGGEAASDPFYLTIFRCRRLGFGAKLREWWVFWEGLGKRFPSFMVSKAQSSCVNFRNGVWVVEPFETLKP